MAKRYKQKGSRGRAWTPEALLRREKAIGRNPWGGFNHNNLGCEFARVGYWIAAVSEFEKAVEINPWQASFKANLARAYLSAGDARKAQQTVEAALQQDPNLVEGMFAAGLIHEKIGHAGEAIRWYRCCLDSKPSLGTRREAEESLEWLTQEQRQRTSLSR